MVQRSAQPTNQTFTFPVKGMSCAVCATAVEDTIKSVAGVNAANVNFSSAEVTFQIDSPTLIETISEKLKGTGYELITEDNFSIPNAENSAHVPSGFSVPVLINNELFWVWALALPILLVSMLNMHPPREVVFFIAIATAILVFYLGRNYFFKAKNQLTILRFGMDTLVAISTSVAFVSSSLVLFSPQFAKLSLGLEHYYFESAAVIVAFLKTGKWLEDRVKTSTNQAINNLTRILNKVVDIQDSKGNFLRKSSAQVKVGDVLLIAKGEEIALDGRLQSETALIDESLLSGEPIPITKNQLDVITSGSVNVGNPLLMEVTSIQQESYLQKLIIKIKEAQNSKAPIQSTADKVASYFVPAVVLIALTAFTTYMALGNASQAWNSLMGILVIACPCALGLATPTAITAGMGLAAKKGIKFKNASSLEALSKADGFIFDKTGTLTEGKPHVLNFSTLIQPKPVDIQQIINAVSQSNHPLSIAIKEYFLKNFRLEVLSDFQSLKVEEISGMGIQLLDKSNSATPTLLIGNKKLFLHYNTEWPFVPKFPISTLVGIAKNGNPLGLLEIQDPTKTEAKELLGYLNQQGKFSEILSGDRHEVVNHIAAELKIKVSSGEQSPEMKAEKIASYGKKGINVVMVGDGINDSLAMGQSYLSVAMGHGADIAKDTADVVLPENNIFGLKYAHQISSSTLNTIKQNLYWAFGYNLFAIPLAAGLFSGLGLMLNPMWAAAIMAFSSIAVVLNSYKLSIQKIK